MIVPVRLGARGYSIVVEPGALATVGERLRELGVGSRTALFSDDAIMRLHGKTVEASLHAAGFTVTRVDLPEGERAKTLAVAERCWDALLAAGLDRSSTVLALGGDSGWGRRTEVLESLSRVAHTVSGGVVARCGHWMPEEQPAEVASRLAAFFR